MVSPSARPTLGLEGGHGEGAGHPLQAGDQNAHEGPHGRLPHNPKHVAKPLDQLHRCRLDLQAWTARRAP